MSPWVVLGSVFVLAACSQGPNAAQEARVASLEAQLQEVRGKLETANAEVDGLKAAVDDLNGALATLGSVRSPKAAEKLVSAYGVVADAVDGVDGAVQDALATVEEEGAASGTLLKTARHPAATRPSGFIKASLR